MAKRRQTFERAARKRKAAQRAKMSPEDTQKQIDSIRKARAATMAKKTAGADQGGDAPKAAKKAAAKKAPAKKAAAKKAPAKKAAAKESPAKEAKAPAKKAAAKSKKPEA